VTTIRVSALFHRPPAEVWARVEDLGSHVEWMADAEAIRFTSDRRQGVGTTFDCDTRVGPLHLTDHMQVTLWREGEAIGVRHVGLVTGDGRFTLTPRGTRSTEFAWEERLTFPWWMGAAVGAAIGGQVLKLLWRGNLRRLKALVEA
jgi:hypothetical protein